jgi:hypothetical protein
MPAAPAEGRRGALQRAHGLGSKVNRRHAGLPYNESMTETRLRPCPACARHVRASEDACPFCRASVSASLRALPAPEPPRRRLSRAALLAFSAGAAGMTAACGGRASNTGDLDASNGDVTSATDGATEALGSGGSDGGAGEGGGSTGMQMAIDGSPALYLDAGDAGQSSDAAYVPCCRPDAGLFSCCYVAPPYGAPPFE